MTNDEEIRRGARAGEVLENPLFIEAMSALENEVTEAWKTSPLKDVEGRERLRNLLAAAQKVQMYLVTTMETGQLALKVLKPPPITERVMQWTGMR